MEAALDFIVKIGLQMMPPRLSDTFTHFMHNAIIRSVCGYVIEFF